MRRISTALAIGVGGALGLAVLAAACSSSPSGPTPQPQQQATPTLTTVSFNPSSLAAGNSTTGTIALSGATTNAATVNLSINPSGPTIPSTVTIAAGTGAATFPVTTQSSNTATTYTITASLNGTSVPATLTLTAAPVTVKADFSIVADANTGTTPGTLQCAAVQISGQARNELKCKFDGTSSTPSPGITAYTWTLSLDGNNGTASFSGSVVDHPTVPCNSFGNATRDLTLKVDSPNGSNTTTKQVTFLKPNAC